MSGHRIENKKLEFEMLSLDFHHMENGENRLLEQDSLNARSLLEEGTGIGAGMRGWLNLPDVDTASLEHLKETAGRIRTTDGLVVIGIGGSHQGASAVIRAIAPYREDNFPVHFAGHHLDATALARIHSKLNGKRFAVNLISKSGTTMEPWLVFQLMHEKMKEDFSNEELRRLVIGTTGPDKSLMRDYFEEQGYQLLGVPHDVGGRYSVLSNVGLLPIAAAGLDIDALLSGARDMMRLVRDPQRNTLSCNPALAYAVFRHSSYRAQRKIEVLISPFPRMGSLGEWWKQLFGESEGKSGMGLFPASMTMPSDLHSLGQWMQDGEPIAFETAIDVLENNSLPIKAISTAGEYAEMDGKTFHQVNRSALLAALEAHVQNSIPVLRVEVPRLDEYHMGALIYFFEYSCALSAYMLGVNPFDQEGVQEYKHRMNRINGL